MLAVKSHHLISPQECNDVFSVSAAQPNVYLMPSTRLIADTEAPVQRMSEDVTHQCRCVCCCLPLMRLGDGND